uniref:AMP-binding domain-containing protein n=1 Tax=Rhabditophanes sp. KR3021 TaxID=114890 RepID=A0AC35TT76_9BILA
MSKFQVNDHGEYCLDFTRSKEKFDPLEKTIPDLIHSRNAWDQKDAFVCDGEKVNLTFTKVSQLMDQLAAGLLTSGLKSDAKVLISGYNHYEIIICALACSRAGMVFCLTSPKVNQDELHELIVLGSFNAIILFGHGPDSDLFGTMILDMYPEMKKCHKGSLKLDRAPSLTHVILACENYRHVGTYTLSDIYNKGTTEKIKKLPEYRNWNPHKLAAIQATSGHSQKPRLAGLSHYQLINGSHSVSFHVGVNKDSKLCIALPFYRISVFCLAAFTPFINSSVTIISEPSPIPRLLFKSIAKNSVNYLMTNGIALRLLLRISKTQKVTLPTIKTCILLGENIHPELLNDIPQTMPNTKKIACGYLLTETGSIPLFSTNIKTIGNNLPQFDIEMKAVDGLDSKYKELFVRPFNKTKFFGYAPTYGNCSDWIATNDIVIQNKENNIELVTQRADLIIDQNGLLVEHWVIEKTLSKFHEIKGSAQVVSISGEVVAVVIPTDPIKNLELFRSDLVQMCKQSKVRVPDKFAIVSDFPRSNARIKKSLLRAALKNGELIVF